MLLDKIVIGIISPLGTGLLAWLLASLFLQYGVRRLGVMTSIFGIGWLLLWSMPFASSRLADALEQHYPPVLLESIPKGQAIVVLGGGVTSSGLPSDSTQPFNLGDAADRVLLGSRLYHLGKAPIVVFSGGGLAGQAEANAMAMFAGDLGVPASAVLLEGKSRNTRENASFTADLLLEEGVSSILLVTSAFHMKRALRHFEAQGFEVVAVATDYNAPMLDALYCCIPDTRALDFSGKAFKEIVAGIVHSG